MLRRGRPPVADALASVGQRRPVHPGWDRPGSRVARALAAVPVSMAAVAVWSAVVLLPGCGHGRVTVGAPGTEVTLGARTLRVVTGAGAVCVGPVPAPLTCLPLAGQEALVSASLAPMGAQDDLLALLAWPDVELSGLADPISVPVRAGGRALVLWLQREPPRTERVCARYRTPAGAGRLIVHRTVPVGAGVSAEAETAGTDEANGTGVDRAC